MQDVILKTNKRESRRKALKGVRGQGLVPGVVYGQGKEATPLQVNERELDKAYHEAGTSKLVELHIEGETQPKNVLFHDVQIDPLSQKILHFDLYTVRMDEKIKTEVPLHFEGEAPAVYNSGAMLLQPLEAVEVEALPKDLPENIVVDINGLEEVGQEILVKDLDVPAGVTIINEPEQLVAKTEEQFEQPEEEEEEVSEEEAVAAVGSEHGEAEEGEAEGDEKAGEAGESKTEGKPEGGEAKAEAKPEADKPEK